MFTEKHCLMAIMQFYKVKNVSYIYTTFK